MTFEPEGVWPKERRSIAVGSRVRCAVEFLEKIADGTFTVDATLIKIEELETGAYLLTFQNQTRPKAWETP